MLRAGAAGAAAAAARFRGARLNRSRQKRLPASSDGTPLASEGVASAFLLRRRPYELLERVQSQADAAAAAAAAAATRRPFAGGYKGADAAAAKCPGDDGDAPLQPVWSGLQLRAWIARGAERGAALWSEFDAAKAARRGAAP